MARESARGLRGSWLSTRGALVEADSKNRFCFIDEPPPNSLNFCQVFGKLAQKIPGFAQGHDAELFFSIGARVKAACRRLDRFASL
jgi:hypothetical protein